MNMLALMYVAIGGAVGSMGRYIVMSAVESPGSFPLGTMVVNILGGFLLGAMIAFMVLVLPNKGKDLHLLLAVGLLGGFTTFSAFSMDIYMLLERGLVMQTALYILGSVILSVVAFLAGMWCIRFAFT
jgi:fluoride exporter